jgi:radical SAM-linked protein
VRPGPAAPAPPIYRYRLGFAKLGPARWLGHLDLLRALRLGLVRSGACAAMTRAEAGDRLRIVSSPALPIGVASRAEYVDLEMDGPLPIGWDPDNADGCLPRGLSFGGLVPLPLRARAIQDVVRLATYRARLGELGDDEGARAADRFTREKAVTVNRQRKGKVQTLDIRPQVSGLRFRPPGVLEFSIALAPSGSPRPTEVLEAVVGADLADPLRIERTELLARIGGRWVSPLLAARRSRKLEPS